MKPAGIHQIVRFEAFEGFAGIFPPCILDQDSADGHLERPVMPLLDLSVGFGDLLRRIELNLLS